MLLRWYCQFQTWLARESGANMVEYVILAAVIALGLFATVGQFREAVAGVFGKMITNLKGL